MNYSIVITKTSLPFVHTLFPNPAGDSGEFLLFFFSQRKITTVALYLLTICLLFATGLNLIYVFLYIFFV